MYEIKAFWLVNAGVIPGQKIDQYSKVWEYTCGDYKNDQKKGPTELTRLSEILMEVTQYQIALSDPCYVNWVRSEFIWI